ncbi:MAG: hypothetical protein JW829_05235, partial [Pirellulales bacterium]|nr:hypothetical protein [Pirellulales bacterium]
MDITNHADTRLSRSDLQFSTARILVAMTATCVLLAIDMPPILGFPSWYFILAVILSILFNDWGARSARAGIAAFHRGDTSEAIRLLTKAINARRDYPERYYFRALAYCTRGQIQSALEDLTRVIEIEPLSWAAYDARGAVCLLEYDYSNALQDFSRAIELGSDNPGPVVGRSIAQFKTGDHISAFVEIERCLVDFPDCIDALCTHAWFLSTCPVDSRRDGQLALKLSMKARKLDGEEYWSCESSLSAALAEMGDFEEAIKHGERALTLAPIPRHHDLETRLATLKTRQPLRDGNKSKHTMQIRDGGGAESSV